jgi:hypothetical protein
MEFELRSDVLEEKKNKFKVILGKQVDFKKKVDKKVELYKEGINLINCKSLYLY